MHKALTVVLGFSLLLASCGSSTVQKDGSLEGKKAELTRLKDQQEKLTQQIGDLQAQIDKIAPGCGCSRKGQAHQHYQSQGHLLYPLYRPPG